MKKEYIRTYDITRKAIRTQKALETIIPEISPELLASQGKHYYMTFLREPVQRVISEFTHVTVQQVWESNNEKVYGWGWGTYK